MVRAKLVAWVVQHGYLGLGSVLALGVVGVPVPDEVLLTFAGYQVSIGKLHLVPTLAAAFLGSACGITVSYGAGRILGGWLLGVGERHGFLAAQRVTAVRRWFERFGRWSLTLGYFVPGLRHVIAIIAAGVGVSFPTFALFAYLGALAWVSSFVGLGYLLGEEWHSVVDTLHHHLLVFGAAVTATLAVLLLTRVWWARHASRG
jgi:membrane protein DedA with SNARE-associated domain